MSKIRKRVCQAANCHNKLTQTARGRERLYCSNVCRMRTFVRKHPGYMEARAAAAKEVANGES